MNFDLGISITTGLIRFAPCKGRRTFYASIHAGSSRIWAMRWDTMRAPDNRLLTRDGLMGWTAGISRSKMVGAGTPTEPAKFENWKKGLLPWRKALVTS